MNSHIIDLAEPSICNSKCHPCLTIIGWVLQRLYCPHEVVIHQFPWPVWIGEGMSRRNTIGPTKSETFIVIIKHSVLYPYSLAGVWTAGCWWLQSTTNVIKATIRSAFILGYLTEMHTPKYHIWAFILKGDVVIIGSPKCMPIKLWHLPRRYFKLNYKPIIKMIILS